MRTTVVDCASCGAPMGEALGRLGAGALVPCLYCGALLRFSPDSAEAVPNVERRLDPALTARARDAALRGGRAEAIALCVNLGGVDHAAVAAAVDDIVQHIAHRAVFSQTLNGIGWLMVAGALGLAAVGVLCLALPTGNTLVGLLLLAAAAPPLFALARGVRTSLEFAIAARGVGLIRRAVDVGPTGFSDGCNVFALAIDVTPDGGGEPFHARLVVPVRPTSRERIQEGKRLGVRFRDGGAWIRSDGDREVG